MTTLRQAAPGGQPPRRPRSGYGTPGPARQPAAGGRACAAQQPSAAAGGDLP
jgi:hypothetical protein